MKAVENIELAISDDKTLLQNIKCKKVVEQKSWLKIIADVYENENIKAEWEMKLEERNLKKFNEIAEKKVGLKEEDALAIYNKINAVYDGEIQQVEFAYFATLQFMQDIFSEFNSAEKVFVDPVTHSDGSPRRFIRAVGSGLGLPFKKQLLPVAVNNSKKCATDFVLALCNVMAKEKIYLSHTSREIFDVLCRVSGFLDLMFSTIFVYREML